MFNHARTLLVNLAGASGYQEEWPGEELIPTDYLALNLPTYLDVIRSRFFGATPDRAMLNYRTAQLLQLISATELQSHILALDSRITYSSYPRQMVLADTFLPQVTRRGGASDDVLTLVGDAISPDASGKSAYDYQVSIADGKLQIQRRTFPPQDTEHLIVLTDGLSAAYPLPFSGYKVRVNTDSSDAVWDIRGFLRPQRTLVEVEQGLRSVGEPYLLQLFGITDTEPYLTFRNCWKYHPEFAYRIGGLVLAMIYRTEELRYAG